MSDKRLLRILKYIFVSYLLTLLYASILGKEAIRQYQLGSQLMIEEYIVIVIILIVYDLIKDRFTR